jgi:hypothetical protein
MPKLSKSEFGATFDDEVRLASEDYSPCLDFWEYVDALSDNERDGLNHHYAADYIFVNDVRHIEHIMLRTDTPKHYLTIILIEDEKRILGHHVFHADFDAPDWLLDRNPAGSQH